MLRSPLVLLRQLYSLPRDWQCRLGEGIWLFLRVKKAGITVLPRQLRGGGGKCAITFVGGHISRPVLVVEGCTDLLDFRRAFLDHLQRKLSACWQFEDATRIYSPLLRLEQLQLLHLVFLL